jgi:tetratricopeptide (TPR) repeat protein
MLFCAMLAAGCTFFSGHHHLLEHAENIMEEHTDSSLHILEALSPTTFNEQETALYALLLTQAQVKLSKPVESDSLINIGIGYFKRKGDRLHLSQSFFYKGVMLAERGERDSAAFYLKEAESSMKGLDNELLKNRVYDNLAYLNHKSHNFDLALHYARLFMQSSRLMGDSSRLCRSYDGMASNFYALDMKDSMAYYRQKCIELMEKDTTNASHYYANQANDLIERGKYEEAEHYLQKAVKLKPKPSLYVMMGRTALGRGDTAQARKLWEHALSFGQIATNQQAYNYLATLAFQRGDSRQAFLLKEKADSALFAYSKQVENQKLGMIQQKHDKAMAEQKLNEKKMFWLKTALGALSLVLALLIVAIKYKRKMEKYRSAVNQDIEQMNEARRRIEFLESTGEDYAQEIDSLRRQVALMKEATATKLGFGKDVYEKIMAGSMTEFNTSKEQFFVDYFAFTNPLDFALLCKPYKSPTLRHTTYLILQHIGLNDQQIQAMLGVSSSTIRSYRHRLKKNA